MGKPRGSLPRRCNTATRIVRGTLPMRIEPRHSGSVVGWSVDCPTMDTIMPTRGHQGVRSNMQLARRYSNGESLCGHSVWRLGQAERFSAAAMHVPSLSVTNTESSSPRHSMV